MLERLTITVEAGGEDADARLFGAVLDDVLDALEAIAREKGEVISWRIVALEKHSPPKVTLGALSNALIIATLLKGMTELQVHPTSPFSMPAMRAVKRLGERIGKGVDRVLLEGVELPPVTPSPQMAKNAEQVLEARFYRVAGSVDGKLDIINIHSKAKFSIFDDIDGREVRCDFPDELLDVVKQNIGRRVTAIGDVRYRRDTDDPVSIVVEQIEPIDGDEEPKLLSEMPSIDIAGGIVSEDYVRRLRDGE